jgi:hypothetical protein
MRYYVSPSAGSKKRMRINRYGMLSDTLLGVGKRISLSRPNMSSWTVKVSCGSLRRSPPTISHIYQPKYSIRNSEWLVQTTNPRLDFFFLSYIEKRLSPFYLLGYHLIFALIPLGHRLSINTPVQPHGIFQSSSSLLRLSKM